MSELLYNFNAGPSTLPREVVEATAQACLDFNGSGLSLMEIPHRSPEFKAVLQEARSLVRTLLDVPQDYEILFLSGGARMEFCRVPYNFLRRKAAYLDTGTWAWQALQEAGIKILNVDAQVKEMDYVDAYIGSDNYTAGQLCGEDLMEKQPEGGKIAILECPTQNSVNDRITGFEETIANAENGFEVVARADTGGQFERALEETQEILKEFPDLTAIMCGNDQMAVGAKTAVNLAEMKDVIIYGVDGSPDIKKELKKTGNQIAGTAAQSPINMGKSAAELVLKMLKGEPFERETYEEVFMINAENVDMYGTDGWQ